MLKIDLSSPDDVRAKLPEAEKILQEKEEALNNAISERNEWLITVRSLKQLISMKDDLSSLLTRLNNVT
jgi:vacuolar-type H+-ATPase subunit E/Vma4